MNTIFTSTGKKFWETNPTETWDAINGSEYDETRATTAMQNKNTATIFNCLHKTFLFFLPELGWGVTTTALSWQAGWWWRIDRWISTTTTTTTTTTPTISKRDKQIHFCKLQFELTALLSGPHCKCLVYWWTQIPFQRGLWNWWVRTYGGQLIDQVKRSLGIFNYMAHDLHSM